MKRLCWLYPLLQHRFTAFWRQLAFVVKLGKLGLAQCWSNSNGRQQRAILGELQDPVGARRDEQPGEHRRKRVE
ncbi:hypothetical protein H9L39_03443 [Fusarium oxysporum f. sp. albedinis]|nr:hypothetical protein H9L39_03443 [Fusarium oxysporum f. sp. albedinis]